ncbi:flippase-like domain-containing protein [Candidatus Woesearchaeota archaeon]|nr:flippase-like domain-containing protein [Candidatus Woesearchaeota archaeon]
MKKNLKAILEVSIAVIVIVFLLSKINLEEVIELLKAININWIIVGLGVYIISILITGYSLKALFDSKKQIPFGEWMRFYLMGFSLGLILPGRAGDLSIIYLAKEKGFDIGESTAITLTDKLITLIIFGIIAALGLFTILKSSQLYLGLIVAIIFISSGLFIFSSPGRKLARKIMGKYAGSFQGFHRTFSNLIHNHKDKIAINTIITLLRPLGNALLIIIIFKAMGLNISLWYAILINAVTLIASLIPLTPNGIGIKEGIGVYLFTLINIPAEASVGVYFIIILMNYATGIIGTTYYLLYKKKSNNSLHDEAT